MTVIEHIEELRFRLFISVLAVAAGFILAYFFYGPILRLLKHPLDAGGHIGKVKVDDLYVTGIATAFVLRMKVAMFAGFILALPVVLYQLWRFITPGLEPTERRYAVPFILASVVLFSLGAYLAFWVAPYAIHFLLGYAAPPLKPLIHFTEYMNFIILMVLVFGLSFEYPLVLIFLAIAGVLTSKQLRKGWRYAIFLSCLFAAVATPQQDPISNIALALPLYLLYEISILVIRFGLRK